MTSTNAPKILVTGAGGAATRNFIKCLRMAPASYTIIGVDTNKQHLACNSMLDRSYKAPPCNEKSAYLDMIGNICQKQGISLVHPQPDQEVAFWSEHRFDLRALTHITRLPGLPEKRTIRICQDKFLTHKALLQNSAPTPRTEIVGQRDLTQYPAWVRARRGAGSKAALPIANREQLDGWLNYWGERGLTGTDFIASEILPGREYAFQSLWWEGQLIASAARCRLEYAGGAQAPSGQTSSPSIAISVHNAQVNEAATAAIMAVTDNHPHGVFCVDLKEDEEGQPKTTEINAGRFFTTSDFFATAGCNMPHMYMQLCLGKSITPVGHDAVPKDLYWVRGMDREPTMTHKDKM